MLNAFPRLLYFQKGNIFTGDHCGMRYRLWKTDAGLSACVWPEPLCFASADEADKTAADFELSEEGLQAACDFVRGRYESDRAVWDVHYTKPKK